MDCLEVVMRVKILAIFTFAMVEVLQVQTINLKGRVVQANGTPSRTRWYSASGGNAGLSFLRPRLGGETFTHPFFHSGSRSAGTVLAPPYRGAAAKQAAVVDTLRIRKAGYQDYVKEIASYTAGNLGDLTLTSSTTPDGWTNLFNGKDPVGWGKNNSGLMIFGIDPAKVTGDPEFPPLIEIQLLGSPSNPGGGGSTKPVFTMSGPMYNNQPVTGGYLSLQSESQPCEFKDILLKELPQ